MTANRTYPLICAALLLLAACETVVQVEPPPFTPELAAQAFFSSDSLWVVRVTHSVPYTAPDAPGTVEDAMVTVEAPGERPVVLARADSGTYVGMGPAPVGGQAYTLRVAAEGYPPIEGHNTLPSPVNAVFTETLVLPDDTASRRQRHAMTVTLDDPAGEANYYALMVVQARASEDRRTGQLAPLPPSLFPFESDTPALEGQLLDVLNTDKTIYRDAFFSDALFDGTAYTVDFAIQYDAPSPAADIAIRRAFAVVVLSVSEDFYRYWRTASEQALANENPFAEPLRVHSNMTGGLGIFAGFQYQVFLLPSSDTTALVYSTVCDLLGPQLPACFQLPGVP